MLPLPQCWITILVYKIHGKPVAAFIDAGIDTFMLQFNPFAREMTRFAEEVMPRVRHLQPVV